jgi:alkaline phosphatase D
MNKAGKLLLLLLIVALGACNKSRLENKENYVLLISFDGFRWDYPDLYQTPNFDALAREGVKAESLIPSFPTKTFPNHYTLATGLYPDHHGIINNSFYAPDLEGIYRIGEKPMVTNPDSYFGEPIWVTAEKQGCKSACYFWVGSEAAVAGTSPSYWKAYDGSVPYAQRVDTVMHWLNMPPENRPGLVMLYFDEPDHTGHEYGPEHEATGEVVVHADSILGYIRSGLAELDHGDQINLIVLSDHGMAPISSEKYVNLADHMKKEWTSRLVGGNPVYLAEPAEGCADSITHALNLVEGLSAWQKDDIPDHLHYGSSPRFPGILVVADPFWSIGTRSDPSGYAGGAHGYDYTFSDMHAIFYAEGPAFKENHETSSFSNVEIYGILAKLLGLDPADTDGDISRVSDLFKTE